VTAPDFDSHADSARARDAADDLAALAGEFERPPGPDGSPAHYLCGHSLGLMPRAARTGLERELARWAGLGVRGHFDRDGWYGFHERFAAPLAALVGADANEVVAMNSLTVNLHLMLVSFFEPAGERRRILIERGAFPSDRFAVASQLRFHGLDPARDLLELGSTAGELVTADALDAALTETAGSVALVLLPGVQFLTGEAVDLAACAAVARRHGCRIGFDLAHAIGNLAVDLRAADPDFAVWCSYKYLNGGPGAIGGCFVNRRWLGARELPRFAGWWGHDKHTRFETGTDFAPLATAEAWQLSNPPVLAMAPLAASLKLFTTAGIARLRHKSIELTAYLEALLEHRCGEDILLLTPRDATRRGAQLSLRIGRDAAATERVVDCLRDSGVVVDWRAPDVIRLAPVPIYNGFIDVHASVAALAAALRA
jgi:kynureninase